MSKRQVYISYSHAGADREWIRKFAESLQHENVTVWLDEWQIRVGESIGDSVAKGLRESDIIVAVIHPQNVRQPWLFFELGAAIGMGKQVVAVVSKDVDFSQLPQSLRARKFLWQESPEETAHALVTATLDAQNGSTPDRSSHA